MSGTLRVTGFEGVIIPYQYLEPCAGRSGVSVSGAAHPFSMSPLPLGVHWGRISAPLQLAISVVVGVYPDFRAFNKDYNSYCFALNMPMI